VLIELTGPSGGDLNEHAESALAELFEAGLATDGVLAANEAQRAHMWWMRETLPECNRRTGAISSHDISLPLSRIGRFITEGRDVVAGFGENLRINCFGHVGDGNLHYNVFPPEGQKHAAHVALAGPVRTAIHDLVHAHGGSISAEHGIGRMKTGDLVKYADPTKLAAMRAIKMALDPRGILNPGALLVP
jgi:FAD/FMN-containing dehydrogenase